MTCAGIVLPLIAYVREVQISLYMNLEFRGASRLLDNCLVQISKEVESEFGFCLTACNPINLIEDTVTLYTCMHACLPVCVFVCVPVCVCVCMYVCTYICTYVCTYVLCMYACMHVCLYVCTNVYSFMMCSSFNTF